MGRKLFIFSSIACEDGDAVDVWKLCLAPLSNPNFSGLIVFGFDTPVWLQVCCD